MKSELWYIPLKKRWLRTVGTDVEELAQTSLEPMEYSMTP